MVKMKYLKNKALAYIFLITGALLPASCKEQSLETTYSAQEDRIDSFIQGIVKENPDVRIINNSGSNRVVLTEGDGTELAEGGTVSFYYAGYVFNGAISPNNLFGTNREETSAEAKWEVTNPDYSLKTIRLKKDEKLIKGLYNGLLGVKPGEICYIIFSGKYGFGNKNIGTIPANSALAYQIWVENVTNN